MYNYLFVLCVAVFFVAAYKRPAHPLAYFFIVFSFYFFSVSLGEKTLLYSSEETEFKWLLFGVSVWAGIASGWLVSRFFKFSQGVFLSAYELSFSLKVFVLIISPFAFYELYTVLRYYYFYSSNYGDVHAVRSDSVAFGNPVLMLTATLVSLYAIRRSLIYLAGVVLFCIYFIVIGERGSFSLVALMFIPLFLLNKKNLLFVPALFLVMVGLASVYGTSRAQLQYGPIHFVSSIADRVFNDPFSSLSPVDVNEFFNVSATAKHAIHEGVEYDYPGMNYIRGIGATLPYVGRYARSDEFGQNIGEYLRLNHSRPLMEAGIITGDGNVVLYGIEAFIVGGHIFVFISSFIFCFLLAVLYNMAVSNQSGLLSKVMLIVSFPVFVLYVQRSTFESVAPVYSKQFLIIVVFSIAFSMVIRTFRARGY